MFGLFGMPKLGKNHLLIDFVNLVYIVGQFLATYFIVRYGLNYSSNFLNESLYKII